MTYTYVKWEKVSYGRDFHDKLTTARWVLRDDVLPSWREIFYVVSTEHISSLMALLFVLALFSVVLIQLKNFMPLCAHISKSFFNFVFYIRNLVVLVIKIVDALWKVSLVSFWNRFVETVNRFFLKLRQLVRFCFKCWNIEKYLTRWNFVLFGSKFKKNLYLFTYTSEFFKFLVNISPEPWYPIVCVIRRLHLKFVQFALQLLYSFKNNTVFVLFSVLTISVLLNK